jgi:nickel/cobalt exporter
MQLNARPVAWLFIAGACLWLAADQAHAANSLGLGASEQAIKPEGMFASVLMWLQNQQAAFYKLLTGELKEMRTDGSHVYALAGLSFAYGIFHAAGPGHGKAVISSYMLANEIAARRGIVLAFASAVLQALTAIAVIAILSLVLRGVGIRVADATWWLEVVSFAGVTALGAWLLWRKIFGGRHDHAHGKDHAHAHGHHDHGHDHEHHVHDESCGHLHAPDPKTLGKQNFSLRQAWTAILAVGLRPCSGALVVLTFAFLNGLYFAGIASTFAMALGTGITVAVLAAMAVWAKDAAVRIGGAANRGASIHRAVEIGGAAMVFLFGVTLLGAALTA